MVFILVVGCIGAVRGMCRRLDERYLKILFLLSYFCMTKRMVQGGEATFERRRRDRVGLAAAVET